MSSNTPLVVPSVPRASTILPLSSSSVIAALAGLFVVYIANSLVRGALTRRKLPPGPPGLPILGNLWDVKGKAWIQYTEWARTYGPIFSLNMAGEHAADRSPTSRLTCMRSGLQQHDSMVDPGPQPV